MDQESSSTVLAFQALLTSYLRGFANVSARWYPIISDVDNNLASFLGLDYHLRYLPLLLKCRLLKVKRLRDGEYVCME